MQFQLVFSHFLLFLIGFQESVSSNEILGCGGFIKSHADIDFSKVEVSLLTKQGLVKDKTDCSPSNGYFFLPIFNKGQYVLKVSGQAGWSFQPETIEINFDGENDICSQGKDVNFSFKGFGITGKVALAGQIGGAKGVDINLLSEKGESISQTVTDINGIFSFTPIIPGNYKIKATHSSWHFAKSEYNVIVDTGNTELPENSLVVAGFDVNGVFKTNDQDIPNIGLALFKEKNQSLISFCTKNTIPGITSGNPKFEASPTCYSQIDKKGKFGFKAVAPGKYLIRPVVENKNMKIHIEPQSIEIEVNKDVLQMSDAFEFSGLTVSGSVLSSESGHPISGAIVKVNGNLVVSTDKSGRYTLENIKTGSYLISVEANDLKFEEKTVQIELTTSKIPEIFPSSYKVCGNVISEESFVVGITKMGSTFHTTATSMAGSNGEWCTFLPSGKYNFEVLTTEKDKSSGIQFFPVQQAVEIHSSPHKGITFSQLRATLTGEIKCLSDSSSNCKQIEVTLHPLDSTGATTGQTEKVKARNGKYSFENILPGPYEITIPNTNMCFESNTILINVNSAKEVIPAFIHKGYEVSFIASHNDKMIYSFINAEKTPTKGEVVHLGSGLNTFCVNKAGSYNLRLMGCHVYPEDVAKTFSTDTLSPVTFPAKSHNVAFRINTPRGTKPELVHLVLDSKVSGKRQLVPIVEADKPNSFKFETQLVAGEEITLTPQSFELLFKPEKEVYVMPNDCVDLGASFHAVKGLIIEGQIVPLLSGAEVILSFPKNAEIASQKTVSNEGGKFKFSAIDESLEYTITAEKESYVFSDYDKTTRTFRAYKLCEIVVKAKDNAGNKLAGVLLSLSGSDRYRKNLVTGDDGVIKFHSLSPSEYFLKPMMKEYKFNPNSKLVPVKDGETVEVEIVAERVAYSVFGIIASISKEPFADVHMEAVSNAECMHHQEEASSEANGNFRIRGLKPGCKYVVRAKKSDINRDIESIIPVETTVTVAKEDVKDVNFIAIPPVPYVDVSANIFATNKEHYKTLRILLYRKGNADTPIYSQRVESPLDMTTRVNPGIMVFFPRIPVDGRTYVIELRSSLSDRMYTYTLPSAIFVADQNSVFVNLRFAPELKSTDPEMNQSSLSALILVALVAIAFCRQDLAMAFIKFVWTHLSKFVQRVMEKQQAANTNKNSNRKPEPINYKEIEQLADSINAVKKKKPKKIN